MSRCDWCGQGQGDVAHAGWSGSGSGSSLASAGLGSALGLGSGNLRRLCSIERTGEGELTWAEDLADVEEKDGAGVGEATGAPWKRRGHPRARRVQASYPGVSVVPRGLQIGGGDPSRSGGRV